MGVPREQHGEWLVHSASRATSPITAYDRVSSLNKEGISDVERACNYILPCASIETEGDTLTRRDESSYDYDLFRFEAWMRQPPVSGLISSAIEGLASIVTFLP